MERACDLGYAATNILGRMDTEALLYWRNCSVCAAEQLPVLSEGWHTAAVVRSAHALVVCGQHPGVYAMQPPGHTKEVRAMSVIQISFRRWEEMV